MPTPEYRLSSSLDSASPVSDNRTRKADLSSKHTRLLSKRGGDFDPPTSSDTQTSLSHPYIARNNLEYGRIFSLHHYIPITPKWRDKWRDRNEKGAGVTPPLMVSYTYSFSNSVDQYISPMNCVQVFGGRLRILSLSLSIGLMLMSSCVG